MHVFYESEMGNVQKVTVAATTYHDWQMRLHIRTTAGSVTLYLTVPQAESLAFHLTSAIQEQLTEAQNAPQ